MSNKKVILVDWWHFILDNELILFSDLRFGIMVILSAFLLSSYNYNFVMIDGEIIKLNTQWLWGENLLKDKLVDRYNLQHRDM